VRCGVCHPAATTTAAAAAARRVRRRPPVRCFAASLEVVAWGDHGFKLGERGQWGKNGHSEVDARVPLVFALPWALVLPAAASAAASATASVPSAASAASGSTTNGSTTSALVELVDVFPTLLDLAGLDPAVGPAASQPHREGFAQRAPSQQPQPPQHPLEGSSIAPLLRNASLAASIGAPLGAASIGAPLVWKAAAFTQVVRRGGAVTGFSMRTDRFR